MKPFRPLLAVLACLPWLASPAIAAGAGAPAAGAVAPADVTGALPPGTGATGGPACAASHAQRLLARGFNLTGWLDNEPARLPDFSVLARLQARGFTHVRLPVTAERLMEAFTSREAVQRQLRDLDTALNVLIDLGFAVSLDLHPGERLGRLHEVEPERGFELIDALWHMLAKRYAKRPPSRLFFEVLNEPKVPPSVWNVQGPRLVETIRKAAPHHTLIYGPANFQRIDALLDMKPLDDPNVVYAVHFYDPMIFTHQGLDWSNDPLRDLAGVPFPSRLTDPAIAKLLGALAQDRRAEALALVKTTLSAPWTEERIAADIARAGDWSARHGRAVIINEFGVLGWKAAPGDRARWLRAVRTAAERHCIGWAHWDYADGFGFVRRVGEREIPDEAMVDALLGSRSSGSH